MGEIVDLSCLTELERKELLHCIERYETIMGALGATIKREGAKNYQEKEDEEYALRTIPDRVGQYRTILKADGRFPWRLYEELVNDLDHLKVSVQRLSIGAGLPFFQRIKRRMTVDQNGTLELVETIERTKVAIARVVRKT